MTERNFVLYKRLLVECSAQYDKFAVTDAQKKLYYLQIVPKDNTPKLDQIYLGKVLHYNAAMKSAIVDIGGQEVFLPSHHKLSVGALQPLQIIREAAKGKKAKATEDITIGGEYVVLIKNEKRVILSKKNRKNPKAQELAQKLEPIYASDFGILLRSRSTIDDFPAVQKEIERLKKVLENLNGQSPGLKYDPYDKESEILYLSEQFAVREILCNEESLFRNLRKKFLHQDTEIKYDPFFLFDKNEIRLSKLMKRDHVFEEFSLSINYTEALCVMDVNSGYMRQDSIRENKILQINQQAFLKVLELLDLLNIGGIVLIDFISMEKIEQNKLKDFIEKNLKNHYNNRDRKIIGHSMANSSLFELVIKKEDRDLVHTLSQECIFCKGTGLLPNEKVLLDAFEINLQSVSDNLNNSVLIRVPKFMSSEALEEIRRVVSYYPIEYRLTFEDTNEISITLGE